MGFPFFGKKSKKKIQAGTPEGAEDQITIAGLMEKEARRNGGNGCDNDYQTYSSQLTGTYRKYDNRSELGGWQTRAVIDTRTAFIAGEGISVQVKDDRYAEFFQKVLRDNKLTGSRFYNWVQSGEMCGKGLFYVDWSSKLNRVVMSRWMTKNYEGLSKLDVTLEDASDTDTMIAASTGEETIPIDKAVYVKIGGTPDEPNNTTTRVGSILQKIDNYDRNLNALRVINHLFARPTPHFEQATQAGVNSVLNMIKKNEWKLGQALATTGKFSMVVPSVSSVDSLIKEQAALTKAISFATGIPLHWCGWVDAMSNRSTAESLYETISNATVKDRTIWSEAIYSMLIKAQEAAINNGVKGFNTINYDFEVKIPLISFTKMLPYIQALSTAFNDGAITLPTYTNLLPNVDPLHEEKNKKAALETVVTKTNILTPEMEDSNE